MQSTMTTVEPTAMLQGDDVIHVVTGYDETVTDDSGLISVGRWLLNFGLTAKFPQIYGFLCQLYLSDSG